MSVNNGELADENNFNSSFLSSEVESSTVAKLNLNDPDSANSGPTISNIQRRLNENKIEVDALTTNLAASGTVSLNIINMNEKKRVQGASGAITMSNTPFGTGGDWPDGKLVRLQGMSNTNTVTLPANDAANGALLRDGSVTLRLYDIIILEWDAVLDRWLEHYRNF